MRTLLAGFCVLLTLPGFAAELRPPAQATAGAGFAIEAGGSGEATFYLVGPAQVIKRKIQLGNEIRVQGDEAENAGRYTAIVCDSACTSASFFVKAAEGSRLSFLAHPSRVRVSEPNSISAVAVVLDSFHNVVFAPTSVTFKVVPQGGQEASAARPTENGIAWVRLTSASKEGPTKIGATVGKVSELRVVQQVASDACNLRIKASWVSKQLLVETDPVRDCSGNAVPDGTVVSFTKTDSAGKTTVDSPIKRGIAKVEMPVSGAARITVASGVVTGNELSVAGGGR